MIMFAKRFSWVLAVVALALITGSCNQKSNLLIYTKNGEGFVHDNIEASVKMLSELCVKHGMDYAVSDDPSVFNSSQLGEFDAIVFSNTNNDAFDTDEQRMAFKSFVNEGGGFIGIHSACGSERDWPWFWDLIGGTFLRHPPFQEFVIKVTDASHPSTSFLNGDWKWEDEAYFLHKMNPNIHVLLCHDLNTISDTQKDQYPGTVFGSLFPGAWCQEFDGGRQWYTSYGHRIEHYSDPTYVQHVEGGILWVLERAK